MLARIFGAAVAFVYQHRLSTVHLSTQDMVSGLGWDPLKTRREKHIVKLVKNCLDGQAPSYFSDYFRRRTHDIHDYDTRSKDRLSIDKVNLELTKRAFFFTRGLPFLSYFEKIAHMSVV